MKTLLLVISILFSSSAFAIIDSLDVDYPEDTLPKKVIFGFQLGSNTSSFYSSQKPTKDNHIINGYGVRLGVQAEIFLGDYFSLAPKAELMFNNTQLWVRDDSDLLYESPIMPVSMQFMSHLHFKIPGEKWQPLMMIGPNYRLPVKSENLTQRAYGSRSDLGLDFGIGLERKFKYMTIAPELRYTYGFKDIDKSPFIKSMYHHQIAFVVSIKG